MLQLPGFSTAILLQSRTNHPDFGRIRADERNPQTRTTRRFPALGEPGRYPLPGNGVQEVVGSSPASPTSIHKGFGDRANEGMSGLTTY